MNEPEKEAIRQRLLLLGVDANWATIQALKVGQQCAAADINLQTLLIFALTVASGCRSGLAADIAKEVEDLHNQVDVEADRTLNEARS